MPRATAGHVPRHPHAVRALAPCERGAQRVPVSRDVAAENIARRGSDHRKRARVAIAFRGVEKCEPRQVPQPRSDLGGREVEHDGLRCVMLREFGHAPGIGQMRGLFK